MKYKAVIFDLFGTLIENFSRADYAAVFAEMAAILAVPHEAFLAAWVADFDKRATGVYPTTAAAIKDIAARFNPAVTDDQIERATRIRLAYTERSIIPRQGAIEVLKKLKDSGYKTGLISDCTDEIPRVWGSTPFAPLFDVTVFSCIARIKKPDPRVYHMATGGLGVASEDCLYIGDGSSRELSGARAVGMHPVLIRVPDESDDVHRVDAENETWDGAVITSLYEVLELLSPTPGR
jgi:putative hydrolase of the HAD superfamily